MQIYELNTNSISLGDVRQASLCSFSISVEYITQSLISSQCHTRENLADAFIKSLFIANIACPGKLQITAGCNEKYE